MDIAPTDLIRIKRDGGELSEREILTFIEGVTSGDMSDPQVAAMLMAIFQNGLSRGELNNLTTAMTHSGEVLDLSGIDPPRIDKHSTGGVGDKVSLIFAPLMASLGIRVPMLSGRALGHTGGTLNKLESIAGLRVEIPAHEFRETLKRCGMAIAAATPDLVPADRRIYTLRDATATVGHIPLIASSIMSKKLAVKADGLVLDVKTGSGAFAKTQEDALSLCCTMVEMGQSVNRPVIGLVTRMDQPLGRTVGNALEVKEALQALRGEGPDDLMEVTFTLGESALQLAGMWKNQQNAQQMLSDAIISGKAFSVFREWVIAQGGDPRYCDDPQRLAQADEAFVFTAPRDGYLTVLDALEVGLAAMETGAGQRHRGDQIDPGAGLIIHQKPGDNVRKGQPLVTVFCSDHRRISGIQQHLNNATQICDQPPPPEKRILYRVDASGIHIL